MKSIIIIMFSVFFSSFVFGFEKQADAISTARTKMNQHNFAEALTDADAALKLAKNQGETVSAMMLHAQILNNSGKIGEAVSEYRKILDVPGLADDQRAQVLASIACGKIETMQQPVISDEIGAIQKLPATVVMLRSLSLITEKMARYDFPNAEKIMRDTMKKMEGNEELKVDMLQRILDLHLRYSKYETCKPVMDEFLKAAEGKKIKFDQTLVQFADKAAGASDFKRAEASYRKTIEMYPENMGAYFGAAEMAMLRGDAIAAQSDLQKILDNQKFPAAQRYVARIIQLALASGDSTRFRQDMSKADQEFVSEKFSSEQRFKLLREASSRLFTGSRYDDVRALEAETAAMLRPEEKKSYICRYVKNVPCSADSWARSPLLKDEHLRESRFESYTNMNDDLKSELTKLKDAKVAKTAPNKEGYDTSVYIVYDERGVHIYAKCDDPDARKIEQGLVKGGDLELYFQPGKGHAYHQWFFSLPGTDDPHLVNWDTPHKHYRYTYDYLVKNASVTDSWIGAYTFIPWLMVYDKLPSESNRWIFSMQRWSKNASVTLGGAVHELGRAMELKFEMTGEQFLAVKREIVIRAFAKYQNDRKRADGVSIWSDPVLGDPEFYKSSIQPLLENLDKAGEKVNDKMSDADIELLFVKFVPDWMELQYKAAELRQEYLTKRFLSSTQP